MSEESRQRLTRGWIVLSEIAACCLLCWERDAARRERVIGCTNGVSFFWKLLKPSLSNHLNFWIYHFTPERFCWCQFIYFFLFLIPTNFHLKIILGSQNCNFQYYINVQSVSFRFDKLCLIVYQGLHTNYVTNNPKYKNWLITS